MSRAQRVVARPSGPPSWLFSRAAVAHISSALLVLQLQFGAWL